MEQEEKEVISLLMSFVIGPQREWSSSIKFTRYTTETQSD
jgi:hypothetical protein